MLAEPIAAKASSMFTITRRWFDTIAAPGPGNAYQGQASLDFTLP
jgi:hypothetical protein